MLTFKKELQCTVNPLLKPNHSYETVKTVLSFNFPSISFIHLSFHLYAILVHQAVRDKVILLWDSCLSQVLACSDINDLRSTNMASVPLDHIISSKPATN